MFFTPADVVKGQVKIEQRKIEQRLEELKDKSTLYCGAFWLGYGWAHHHRDASPEEVTLATAGYALALGIKPLFEKQFREAFWKGASAILQ